MKNGMGILNEDAIERGLALGVNLSTGCKNKNDGRVRVFCRLFPGTSKSGYALRSRIVWWIYTGEAMGGIEYNIHHINGDRSDDRIENLEKLNHVEHAHEHNGYKGQRVRMLCRVCERCGAEFKIEEAKLKDKTHKGRFCSPACYQSYPKKLKTHCPRGHEFVSGSYYVNISRIGRKSKSCKICRKENKQCAVG
jgi:hypothetical protein